jgi:2-oxoglutarate dehydrogenase E1 component
MFSDFGPNSGYVQELYELYSSDPTLVSSNWAKYFEDLENGSVGGTAPTNGGTSNGGAVNGGAPIAAVIPAELSSLPAPSADTRLQEKVFNLISAYRNNGHLKAKINPLTKGINPLPQSADIGLDYYGFSEADLEKTVSCLGFKNHSQLKLKDLIEELKSVYCESIGFEYTHLLSEEERAWLQSRIENRQQEGYGFSKDQKLSALQSLVEAETFEAELHKKYVGSKRFSLEGGETLMPMMNIALDEAAKRGVSEAIVGMAHRGRVNMLVHIAGKPHEEIFSEFEDQSIYSTLGSGDVKYHMGYSSVFKGASGNSIKVSLASNPSHLEFVNPVLEGMARAKQDILYKNDRKAVLPILIHGDAAVVGQGVVYETYNLSRVEGYKTGGSLHLIINNQIGFTTNPEESRSTTYCSDGAKAFQAPVFHVNCEDVEAACWATKLALEFRLKFERDVVVDLYCWRKYGHNEGDDPSFTQPISYSEIKSKKASTHAYGAQLISQGLLSEAAFEELFTKYKEKFQLAQERKKPKVQGEACAVHGRLRVVTPETGVALSSLQRVASTLINYPKHFMPHPKLKQILEKRVHTLEEGKGIDWGFAEALAFGSLVLEGKRVRLSGQDVGRGTFSHRHLALNNYEVPEIFSPLTQLEADKGAGSFEVHNSTLSEAAVLGFEFGYSTEAKNALVMWEAQFGDFANGAQVHIDQFIVSSEAKWGQLSGVVLLLPHGYEGQGPEHSSARLERFLQLCGEGNIVVAYPTNAAQQFHLLRRHGVADIKRPLVIMTPKSLLRLQDATCATGDFTSGNFKTIIEDDFGKNPAEKHVVMLSGKLYYDLIAGIKESGKSFNLKIIRVEQLYPFPQFELKKALKDIKVKSVIWAQEEPQNMGAWSYMDPYIRTRLDLNPLYVGREVSASPATGSNKHHVAEQKAIVREVLDLISQ